MKNPPTLYMPALAVRRAKRTTDQGTRAALALGYYDYNRNRYAEARKWLEKAAADLCLPSTRSTGGGNDRSDGAYETALDEFGQFRSRYPPA